MGGTDMNADSPIVEEVRKRRCELSERFGHDLRAYCEHLREVQGNYQLRIVNQITVVQPRKTENTTNMAFRNSPEH
jgi:hypothetical protein